MRIQTIVLCCFLLLGCHKKEEKKSPRSIYDQPVFAELALLAAKEEGQFAHFKRDPFFNLLWENHTFEEGKRWLQDIEAKSPWMKERFDLFRQNDQLGSPRVFDYGKEGFFSPSTLRWIALAGDLKLRLGSLSNLHIVQIGAGYGGLCKILHAMEGFGSYAIVDLPEPLALAKKYLEELGVENVVFLTPEELPKKTRYDLVISDMSFSEFNRSYQEVFFDKILSCSHSGYLLGHIFPKHYGVVPLSFEELKTRVARLKKCAKWEMDEPAVDKEDYFIYFSG